MTKSALATVAALLASSIVAVSATPAITFPVASSSCAGDKKCGPFKWQVDDSIAPPAADFGETTVGIYVGSVDQQILLLGLGSVRDPSKVLELDSVTIPADLGPNGDFYFIRMESTRAKDPETGFPLQAFSAKFSLTGMTGKLSARAQAMIDGKAGASGPAIVSGTSTNSASAKATGLGSNSNSGSTNKLAAASSNNGTTVEADKEGAAVKTVMGAGIVASALLAGVVALVAGVAL